jgi:NOL1/NOP2/fmu family ribosome biogenesis protein
VPDAQRQTILSYFENRFGIPYRVFESFTLLDRGNVYMLLSRLALAEAICSLKLQNAGLPILRKMPTHLKPTTAAIQRFGPQATMHIVDMTADQVRNLLRANVMAYDSPLAPGYVILQQEGHVLGCGLVTPGQLRSLIPKWLVKHQRLAEHQEGTP